jgi:hypothetical protein
MLSESDKGDLDSPVGLPQDLASGDDYDALSASSPLSKAKKGKGSAKPPKGERKKEKPWKSVAGADAAESGLKLTVSPTGEQREDDDDGGEEEGGSKAAAEEGEGGAGTDENEEEEEEEDEEAKEARRKAEEAAAAEAAARARKDAERA